MAGLVSSAGASLAPQHSTVIPAKAGIQYAGASRFIATVSGILDHPHPRVMTAVVERLTRSTNKPGSET
jgi:hypothetical protein